MLESTAPDLARRGSTELVSLLAQRLQGARHAERRRSRPPAMLTWCLYIACMLAKQVLLACLFNLLSCKHCVGSSLMAQSSLH
jgi:hypothetical protein